MAVLVTGGAGYIGSHMTWALLDAHEDVVVLDRLSTGFRWAVAPEARFYRGDVGDQTLLARIFEENAIDAIVHFAGSAIVPESVAHPLAYYHNNTANTCALVEAGVRAGIGHFVFSSTAAVYGSQHGADPVRETAPPQPESPYGLSKLMAELMLRDAAAAHPLRYVALRYFNVAGADPKGRAGQSTVGATHLIKVACEAALGKRSKIDIYGTDYATPDGTGVRDYIHVADLIEAHMRALAYLRAGGDPLVCNCGYGEGFSVLQVIDTVRRISGRDIAVEHGGRRPGDVARIVADPTLARRELGWMPTHQSLEEIVETAFAWEQHLARKNSYDLARPQIRLV